MGWWSPSCVVATYKICVRDCQECINGCSFYIPNASCNISVCTCMLVLFVDFLPSREFLTYMYKSLLPVQSNLKDLLKTRPL